MPTSSQSFVGETNAAGHAHGQGRRVFPSGHVYEGSFVDGRQHGRGTFKFPDGQVFVGEWVHGKRHGPGRLTLPDGQVMEGTWVDDAFQGSLREEPTPTPQSKSFVGSLAIEQPTKTKPTLALEHMATHPPATDRSASGMWPKAKIYDSTDVSHGHPHRPSCYLLPLTADLVCSDRARQGVACPNMAIER